MHFYEQSLNPERLGLLAFHYLLTRAQATSTVLFLHNRHQNAPWASIQPIVTVIWQARCWYHHLPLVRSLHIAAARVAALPVRWQEVPQPESHKVQRLASQPLRPPPHPREPEPAADVTPHPHPHEARPRSGGYKCEDINAVGRDGVPSP